MSAGRLIAVVGPSGVGKDRVIDGIATAEPAIKKVRRVITRDSNLCGEDHDTMRADAFRVAATRGDFCIHWGAHDLHYGIPAHVLEDVKTGVTCIVNMSRHVLSNAHRLFPQMTVLNLTAHPDTLAKRLTARGREDTADISRRLARANTPLPSGLNIIHISNEGRLSDTITLALKHLSAAMAADTQTETRHRV